MTPADLEQRAERATADLRGGRPVRDRAGGGGAGLRGVGGLCAGRGRQVQPVDRVGDRRGDREAHVVGTGQAAEQFDQQMEVAEFAGVGHSVMLTRSGNGVKDLMERAFPKYMQQMEMFMLDSNVPDEDAA